MIASALPPALNRSLTYYLSGPMSGYENFNYPAFHTAKEFLELCGLSIESPHTNPWPQNHQNMSAETLWQHMMRLCVMQMESCDGIILLRGWAHSRGARIELDAMVKKSAPVYFFDELNHKVVDMNRAIAA